MSTGSWRGKDPSKARRRVPPHSQRDRDWEKRQSVSPLWGPEVICVGNILKFYLQLRYVTFIRHNRQINEHDKKSKTGNNIQANGQTDIQTEKQTMIYTLRA